MKRFFICMLALVAAMLATQRADALVYWQKVYNNSDQTGYGRLLFNEATDGMTVVFETATSADARGWLTALPDYTGNNSPLAIVGQSVNDARSVWVLEYAGQMDWNKTKGFNQNQKNNSNTQLFYLRNYQSNTYISFDNGTGRVTLDGQNHNLRLTADKSKAGKFLFTLCISSGITKYGTWGPNADAQFRAANWANTAAERDYTNCIAIACDPTDTDQGPSANNYCINNWTPNAIREIASPTPTTYNSVQAQRWGNSRPWNLYMVDVMTNGADILQAILDTYTQNGWTPEKYQGGNAPGFYSQQEADDFTAVWEDIEDAIASGTVGDDEVTSMMADLQAAQQAVDKVLVPLTNGYYRIRSAYSEFTSPMGVRTNDILGDDNGLQWGKIDESNAEFVFSIRSTGDGAYSVQNLANDYYANIPGSDALTLAHTTNQTFTALDKAGQFKWANSTNVNGYTAIDAATATQGYIQTQAGAAFDTEGAWYLDPIDSATVAALAESSAQLKKDLTLARLIEQAEATYSNTAVVYTFDAAQALVTDASQYSTNAPEPRMADKTLSMLIDGISGKTDATNFWHSRWSGKSGATEPHYLMAYIPSGVSGDILFAFTRSFNNSNNYPTQVRVTASNDSATWDTLAAAINLPVTDTYVSRPLHLDKSYKYIKYSALKSNNGHSSNGEVSMQYSEFNWYPSKQSDARSATLRADVKDAAATFRAAIDAAQAVTTATDADISALQQAIDAYNAAYPFLEPLEKAIDEARTLANTADVSDGKLLYYDQATVNNFNSFIDGLGTDEEFASATRATLDEKLATLQQATTKFRWAFNTPDENKLYYVVCATADAGTYLNGSHAYVPNLTTGRSSNLEMVFDSTLTDAQKVKTYFRIRRDGSDSTFLFQNVATGYYIQPGLRIGGAFMYVSPDASTAHFCFYPRKGQLAGRTMVKSTDQGDQWTTWYSNPGKTGTFESHFEDVTQTTNRSLYGIEEVTDAQAINLYKQNSIQVVTLPYAITGTPTSEATSVATYKLIGATRNDAGEFTEVKLYPIDENTRIAAGEPFVLEVGFYDQYADDNEDTELNMNLDAANPEVTATAGTADGLVGTLEGLTLGSNGLHYGLFSKGELKAAKGGETIDPQTGYIDVNKIANINTVPAGYTEAYIYPIEVSGDGILNDIKSALIARDKTTVDVYSADGVQVRHNIKAANATNGLPAGVYIVGGHKVLVK